jgi:hypothetical protein
MLRDPSRLRLPRRHDLGLAPLWGGVNNRPGSSCLSGWRLRPALAIYAETARCAGPWCFPASLERPIVLIWFIVLLVTPLRALGCPDLQRGPRTGALGQSVCLFHRRIAH